MDAQFSLLRLCLASLLLGTFGCSDAFRSVDEAYATGSLTVTDGDGVQVAIVSEELTNGAEDYNQVMCATPSLLRSDIPLLTLTGGPRRDLELSVRMVGASIDASDIASTPPALIGAISYQGRELEASEDNPCSFELASYREEGSLSLRMHCPFRDVDSGETFVLAGDVGLHDCFRDRELIVNAGSVIEGFENLIAGPENQTLRELTALGAAPTGWAVLGVMFFAGGHGGYY